MRRNKLKTFCTLLVIAILFTLSTIFVIGAVTEDTTENSYVKIVPYEDVTNYRTSPEEIEGYVFAGWFSDGETCDITTALSSDYTSGPAYAKYVPEEILGVKVQTTSKLWNSNTTDDSTGALRFVTSVDTLNYKEVGFIINITGNNNYKASKYVYQQLYEEVGDGSTTKTNKYVPSKLFHPSSTYFKTWTVNNIDELKYLLDFNVTPYWITLDGTTVTGEEKIVNVNQVRSWDYVFVDNKEEVGTDYVAIGTRNYPYRTLDTALSAMKSYRAQGAEWYVSAASEEPEGKDGIVCIKDSFVAASDYTWTDYDMDVIITSDVADISKLNISDISTVVDASTLDFSEVQTVKIGNGVTFANMILNFQANGAVYASGNRMKIASSVTSENPDTTVYGGGSEVDVSGTDVTILAGSYKAIYGGGRKGDVTGDTHVTLENTDVYDTGTGLQARVHGGCNKGTVKGDTYVTVGNGFNKGLGSAYYEHKKWATVWGGGFSDDEAITSVVEGNTYVTVTGDAMANFISGGGHLRSHVMKTSHVIFESGYALSIYGGSAASTAAKNLEINGTSSNTSVVMTGGEVEQVFGGNEYGDMVGNTSVQILGGTVTRRIFGGCYNGVGALSWDNAFSVTGNSSVTIGTNATVNLSDDEDHSLCAVSRLETNSKNETGILVLNPGKENLDYGFELTTLAGHAKLAANFLVTVDGDGTAYGENEGLRIKPNGNVATVRLGSKTGEPVFYTEGEGICAWTKLGEASTDSVKNIYVVFTDEIPTDVSTDGYEANTNGAYYDTLEEAVNVADSLSTTTGTTEPIVVSLLKDAEVDTTLAVSDSANIKVQSETGATYTVTYANTENNLFDVEGTLALENLNLAGGKSGICLKEGSEVTATDVNVTRSSATGVALVVINEGSTFTLNGTDETSSINGNSLTGRGVDVYGTFVLNGGTIKNNIVQNNEITNEDGTTSTEVVAGAGVYVDGSFTMNGGTIQNNSVEYDGAGVHIADSGKFILNDGTIQNNSSSQSGAGVSVRGEFTMTGGTIQKNTATNHGAGVMAREDATLDLSGGSITTNTATKNGGGVYVQSNNATAISGVTIESNTAADGGGVYVNPKAGTATVTMSAGTIQSNTATNGAGVYVNAGALEMTGGSISGHGTSDARINSTGAGVYVVSGATFDMNGENAAIENNYSSQIGAGVYVEGTFTMSDGTIQGNNTTGNGAGVLVKQDAVFSMSGGKIANNTTSKNGGGLFTQSISTTITGGAIENNTATGTITDETLSDGNGGGVYVHANGILAIEEGTINDNTAVGNGGGIYIATTAADATSNITGGVIEANNATDGAGIYFNTSKAVAMSNVTIQNNIASQNGGGVYVYSTSAFNMTSGTITGNTAVNGGGVYTDNKGIFTLKGGKVTSNTATGNGSGVCVSANDNKPFTMSGGTISGHGTTDARNSSIGAGVYVENGSVFNMTGANAVIENNYSTKSGAGVAVAGTFTMSKGTIQGNNTTGKGAGVYVIDGTFNLNGGSIMSQGDAANSVAGASEGAGVYAAGTSIVTMTAGSISNNYVSGSGAGVSVDGTAKFTLSGTGAISNNTAKASGGGMIVRSKRTETIDEVETLVAAFVMNGGTISDNKALITDKNGGGAIFQSDGTKVEINSGKISGNESSAGGGAIFANPGAGNLLMTGGTIKENTAVTSGAGVYVNSGAFDMTGGTINNNDASVSGGAVYMASTTCKFEMTGGSLNNNTATSHGGAVYVCSKNDNLIINGGRIYKNTSTAGNGGAIAAIGYNTIQLLNGTICGNTGKNEHVDGVFVSDGDGTCKVVFGVDFNMGATTINGEAMSANSIRFNNLRDRTAEGTEPILQITDPNMENARTTLTHHSSENPLNLKLHAYAVNVCVKIQCDSSEAANNIIGALTQTWTHTWSGFEMQEDCITSKCTKK